jgi:hypothetical protein
MDGAYVALRGYKYQFDKTILEIFINPTLDVKIEQIQDYSYDDYEVQVKYHNTDYDAAAQKAKTKKPILQLIENYIVDPKKRYVLYIYLKGVTPSKKTFKTVADLEIIIGKKTGYSAAVLTGFVKTFTVIYAHDFEHNYAELIGQIKLNYCKTLEEAEIYYSIISSYILDLVSNNPPSKVANRITSKAEIDKLIKTGKKIIFRSSFLEEMGKEKYHKYLRKLYFKTGLNTEPLERVFIIEIPSDANLHVVKELILLIKSKWAKNKTKTTPDADRFCPYIFLHNISEDDLKTLKSDLQHDGYIIKDGYNFYKATFNLASILTRPDFTNKIQVKFINGNAELTEFLAGQTKTKEIYQFYFTAPVAGITETTEIKIEIKDLNDIKEII